MKANFQAALQSRLEDASIAKDPSPETLWEKLKTGILKTSAEVLGFSSKKNKDWFDENNGGIQELLVKKRFLFFLLFIFLICCR